MNDMTTQTGNMRDVLHIIFKYKLIIIITTIIAVSVGYYTTTKYKAMYAASAKLLVKIGRENLETNTTARGTISTVNTDQRARIANEIIILRSRELIDRVINKIGIENIYPGIPTQMASMAFQSSLTATPLELPQRQSNIIEVSYSHENGNKVAEFLNIMIEEYLDHHLKIYQQSEIHDFFDNQVKLLKDQTERTGNKLQQLKETYNISELETQKTYLLRQIYDLKNSLTNTAIEINEEESKLKAQLQKEISGAGMGVLEERYNPVAINAVKTRLNAFKIELEELLVRYSEDNVLVVNVKKEIENAEMLVEYETKLYYEKTKITLQDKIASLKIKAENIEKQIFLIQTELSELGKKERDYITLVRQDNLNSETYSLYVKRLEEERISGAMATQKFSNVSIIEKAYQPLLPVRFANKKTTLLLSLLTGLALGIFIAFIIEFFNHCFNKREDIEEHLQLNALASIPDITENKFKLGKLTNKFFNSG